MMLHWLQKLGLVRISLTPLTPYNTDLFEDLAVICFHYSKCSFIRPPAQLIDHEQTLPRYGSPMGS
jgi:hypothetical protein